MNNCKIAGFGTIAAGEYDIVNISGTGKTTGDIKASDISISGIGKFNGNVEADFISSSGTANFEKNVNCKTFKSSGFVRILENLNADSITATGCIKVCNDLNTDKLYIICSGSGCSFKNIYGDDIYIDSKKEITKVEEIEATTIKVKNVNAHKISGEKIEILGKSIVEIVEYSDSITISENCKIKQIIKL